MQPRPKAANFIPWSISTFTWHQQGCHGERPGSQPKGNRGKHADRKNADRTIQYQRDRDPATHGAIETEPGRAGHPRRPAAAH